MKYKTHILYFVVFLSVLLLPFYVQSKDTGLSDLPEKNGIYPVPGHPELTLRVFVHPIPSNHPGKPAPGPTPTPYCGLDDPAYGPDGAIERWYLPSVFPYYLNKETVPTSVGAGNLGTIVTNGFNAWRSAINDKVTLSYAGNTTLTRGKLDGKNIISWGRASAGTLGITYIWFYENGEAAEIDTIMNQRYSWTWSNPNTWGKYFCAYPNTYDAQNIMTHELGHWFGLDDNYDTAFENNTMYGYGDVTETKKDTLTTGDTNAIQSIYMK